MQEEIKNIKKGFNQGYILRKERPSLAKSIESSLASQKDDYSQALISGMHQYDHDISRDRTRVLGIKKLTGLSKDKNMTKNKDKDLTKD